MDELSNSLKKLFIQGKTKKNSPSKSPSGKNKTRSNSNSSSASYKSKGSSLGKKNLLVVFDIDETLIHYCNKRFVSTVWDPLPSNVKDKFEHSFTSNGDLIIFRPYLGELLKFLYKNKAKIGLWTYSDQEYAEAIAKTIKDKYKLKKNTFMFIKSDEHMEHETLNPDGYAKVLDIVYDEFPNFNKFNTFLVDDLISNTNHETNKQNSIFIQPFAPFSVEKVRQPATEESISKSLNDKVFHEIEKVAEKVLKDIRNCSDEDIDDGFTTESVFAPKRVKRMGLTKFCEKYSNNIYTLFTIGEPELKKPEKLAKKKIKKVTTAACEI